MWISEFTCGVLATIAVEFITLVAYAFYLNRKDKEDEENNSTNNEVK